VEVEQELLEVMLRSLVQVELVERWQHQYSGFQTVSYAGGGGGGNQNWYCCQEELEVVVSGAGNYTDGGS
jgi:hypothetical protein